MGSGSHHGPTSSHRPFTLAPALRPTMKLKSPQCATTAATATEVGSGTAPKTSSDPSVEDRLALLEKQMEFWALFKRVIEKEDPELACRAAEEASEVGGIDSNTAAGEASFAPPLSSLLNIPPSLLSDDGGLKPLSSQHEEIIPVDPVILEDLYEFYALQPHEPYAYASLTNIVTVEALLDFARYLHREYMVRLAGRARSLRYAPLGLSQMPSIRELRRWYELSFYNMRVIREIKSIEDLLNFDKVVHAILDRHINTTDLLSNGMYEFANREDILTEKKLSDNNLIDLYSGVQDFFEEFCDTRVRLRLLLGHHIYLTSKLLVDYMPEEQRAAAAKVQDFYNHKPSVFTGQVCHKCDIRQVVYAAIQETKSSEVEDPDLIPNITLYVSEVGLSEPYVYSGERSGSDGDPGIIAHTAAAKKKNKGDTDFKPFTFTCVPSLVYWIVASLVGEAIRSNMMQKECHNVAITPITVVISQGSTLSDVVVKVSDTAGGMPLNVVTTSLTYISSCRQYLEDQQLFSNTTSIKTGAGWNHTPIRMPYAVVAARCVGGDVSVASIEGHGTDRYLYIPNSTDVLKALKF